MGPLRWPFAQTHASMPLFSFFCCGFSCCDLGIDSKAGLDMHRFGVIIGSGIGGLGFMEQQDRVLFTSGPRRVSPYVIPAMIAVSYRMAAAVAVDPA